MLQTYALWNLFYLPLGKYMWAKCCESVLVRFDEGTDLKLGCDSLFMRLGTGFFSLAVLSIILASGLAFADANDIIYAITDLCGGLTNLLPSAAMLMVLVGAVVYAAGQVMGAETRARANVWATTLLTGALIGVLISSVAPPLLQAAYGSSVSCSNSGTCGSISLGPGERCCKSTDGQVAAPYNSFVNLCCALPGHPHNIYVTCLVGQSCNDKNINPALDWCGLPL